MEHGLLSAVRQSSVTTGNSALPTGEKNFSQEIWKLLARAQLAKAPAAKKASPQEKVAPSYSSGEEKAGFRAPQFSFSLAGIRPLAENQNSDSGAFAGQRAMKPSPLPFPIQAKLMVGAVNDPLEHEADRVAEQIMRMSEPRISAPTNTVTAGFGSAASAGSANASVPGRVAGVQRKCDCGGSCDDCKKKHSDEDHVRVQMKAAGPESRAALKRQRSFTMSCAPPASRLTRRRGLSWSRDSDTISARYESTRTRKLRSRRKR